MAKLLGIDIGTSGTKALLIDETGKILRQSSRPYSSFSPNPGWSEQNPEDWVAAVHECLAEMEDLKPDAIGLAGQMHGAVFLDTAGEVLRPAILWNDQRTPEECTEINQTIGADRVLELTCNPPLTGFQAPKILWVRKHEPEVFAKTAHVLLPKDFVRFRLTGQMATDVSDASGTGIFQVPTRCWSDEMIEGLRLNRNWFPDSHESTAVVASTTTGVPVVAGAGDQACAAIGTGAVDDGIYSISLGTSGVVFHSQVTSKFDPSGACHTFCHANGLWHSMGVTLACGGSVGWAAKILSEGKKADLDRLAMKSQPGANGMTFLPYISGERCPHNDPAATGIWAGMRSSTQAADLARSVLEGTAFSLLDAIEAVERLGTQPERIRATSGGTKSSIWLQIISDVLQRPIELLESDQGPAFGAALLAGIGIGIWPDAQAACRSCVRIRTMIEPRDVDYTGAIERYRRLYQNVREWYGPTAC